jgi:hypothetical protein
LKIFTFRAAPATSFFSIITADFCFPQIADFVAIQALEDRHKL